MTATAESNERDEISVAAWTRNAVRGRVAIQRFDEPPDIVVLAIGVRTATVRIEIAVEDLARVIDGLVRASRLLERRRNEKASET